MVRSDRFISCGLVVLFVLLTLPLAAENWPQWRGPHGDGTSSEKGLPVKWGREKGVAWRLALPGPAGSTPAIWGDRIFLTTPEKDEIKLLCVSTGGDVVWSRTVGAGDKEIRGDEGNNASPSPTTDGEHVWAFAGTGDLACFDVRGREVWRKNLQKLYGEYDHWHGMSNTPLLVGDTLYQMCLQMEDPYIVAFDKLTGEVRWKVDRESDARHESRHSYASPILYSDEKRKLLLIHGADYLTAHSLTDGSEVWRVGHLNPKGSYNEYLRFVASPVATRGLVVVPSAKGQPVLGVSPDGKGTIAESNLRWKRGRDTTDVPTPAIHDGIVYLMRENGVLITLDAKSGDEIYLERVHKVRQRASPVVADGRVYIADRNGTVHVVRAGRTFEILASNDMGEGIASTPAISGGRIYVRTLKGLYAIGGELGK